jgi:hypothetical protein
MEKELHILRKSNIENKKALIGADRKYYLYWYIDLQLLNWQIYDGADILKTQFISYITNNRYNRIVLQCPLVWLNYDNVHLFGYITVMFKIPTNIFLD